MDYKELARGLSVISKYEKRRECNEINVGNVMEQASTAITALLHRAEAAEAAQETLQRSMAEYKARAEKAERERDAAIARIKEDHWCDDCKFNPVSSACRNDGNCEECETPCYCGECVKGSLWEWRGQKEE